LHDASSPTLQAPAFQAAWKSRHLFARATLVNDVKYALASADYLGQMAAPDYPDELGILFAEFAESDDFVHIPQSDRLFTSADDLIARTPGFWRNVVRPKLDGDFQGAFHYLAAADGGSNYYIEAVARNIEIIERRSMPSTVTAE